MSAPPSKEKKFEILQRAFALNQDMALRTAAMLALVDDDAKEWLDRTHKVCRDEKTGPDRNHSLKPGDRVIIDLVISDAHGKEAEVIRVIQGYEAVATASGTDEGWVEITSPTGFKTANKRRNGAWVLMPQWLTKVDVLQPTAKEELNKPVGWEGLEKLGWKPDSK